jgi:hypothetical protein
MSLARSTFMARRLLSTTAVQSERQVHPVFHKLKATQQMYQKDNGLVIHLRAGARDKGLFYFTTGLLFAVIGLSAQGWYTMAMKGR